MGRVYEAMDDMSHQRVALKLIDRGADPETMQIVAAERLGVELHKRLCALDPRITAVFESGETSEYLYIVMEYVDGQDLSELSARERIGFSFAARIAQDVLEVFAVTHNFRTEIDGREYRGVVHGDIKPRNIRLTTVGQVKVLDFGIAKAISTTRSYTQNPFGSVQYSSPERLNSGEVTVSSDLWAVGVVLYEMIARRPYFEGESSARLERAIRNYSAIQPLPEDCPEALKQILECALAPDPEWRYQTAEAFANDLKAFRDGRDLTAASHAAELTRRTARGGSGESETRRGVATADPVDDVTRRTTRDSNGHSPGETSRPPRVPVSTVKDARKGGPRWGRIALLVFIAAGALAGYELMKEYVVWQDSSGLVRDIETEHEGTLDTAWDRYQALTKRANFGWSTWSAQSALRNRLAADADRVITGYRNADFPTTTEADWMRARVSATRALQLMPGDKTVRSMIRTIDGQLNRIRGTAHRDSRALQQSRENFLEAAQLDSKSPDPWLGLTRLYVYSLHDVDSAEGALKEAERRHYTAGKRETAQLADGYRDRAERELRLAQDAQSGAEEDRYIDLARRDYERARQLYESIVPWGNAAPNLRKIYDVLEKLGGAALRNEEQPHSESTFKKWWHRLRLIK